MGRVGGAVAPARWNRDIAYASRQLNKAEISCSAMGSRDINSGVNQKIF
jgi:hypothetical protein